MSDLKAQSTSNVALWVVSIGDTSAVLGMIWQVHPLWFAAFRASEYPVDPPQLLGMSQSLESALALFD